MHQLNALGLAVLHLNFAMGDPVCYHEVPDIDVLGSSPTRYAPIRFEVHSQSVVLVSLDVLHSIPLRLNEVLTP